MINDNDILEDEIRLLSKRIISENINPFDAYVGHIIKMKRKSLNLSQQQVAYLIGVTFQQLQKYEKGTNKVSTDKLLDLIYLMKIPQEVFSEGYQLFEQHLNSLFPENEAKSILKINDSGNKQLYQTEKELKQELNRIRINWEQSKKITPLEISPIFEKLTENDFQEFYRANIEEIEATPFVSSTNESSIDTKEDQTTQRIFNLYKKVYQNIETHPLKQIVIETIDS